MLKSIPMHGGRRQFNLDAWKKQVDDPRDADYSIKLHPSFVAGATVPTKVDLRSICSPIVDQGQLGSCTANAFSALIEANENRSLKFSAAATVPTVTTTGMTQDSDGSISFSVKVTPAPAAPPNPPPAPTPAPQPTTQLVRVSRLFEYYVTRKLENTIGTDSGATIRDSIKAAAQYGVIGENLWPYDISKFAQNPPVTVWNSASTHKITSYHSIADGDIVTMKSVLAASVPFLIEFGFSVYDYFLSDQMMSSGLLGKPGKTEKLQGGHAVVLAGYDDTLKMPDGTTGAFLVRNSWGTGWGWQRSGYFWMSYAYVGDKKLCNDFWVVQSQPL